MTQHGHWEAPSASGGKFWEITSDGTTVTTTWGKVGTTGSSKLKDFASADLTAAFVAKTIKSKEKEGYVKTGGGNAAPLAEAAKSKPEKKVAVKPKKTASKKQPKEEEPSGDEPASKKKSKK